MVREQDLEGVDAISFLFDTEVKDDCSDKSSAGPFSYGTTN
jgi:hypothetical protein